LEPDSRKITIAGFSADIPLRPGVYYLSICHNK
jgi:hypothetical protein